LKGVEEDTFRGGFGQQAPIVKLLKKQGKIR